MINSNKKNEVLPMKVLDAEKIIRTGIKMPRQKKKIKKLGTLKPHFVETTPFVRGGRLYNFEWVRSDAWAHNGRKEGYYHIVDMETFEESKPFGYGHAFGCCYEENGTVYVHGVQGNEGWTNKIDVLWSDDMENWNCKLALEMPYGLYVFNTSVCKGPDGYIMAIEVGTRESKHPIAGCNFTIVYAKSPDLFNWELLPMDKYIYSPSKYTACPSIRYYDGYYYIVNLESAPFHRWIPYIVRTPDFELYEPGLINPFLMFGDEDKELMYPERLTDEEKELIETAFNCNNSDVDFCDFNGKTVITYSWGGQSGLEFLAMAEYDGTLEELLKSHFEL